MKNNIPTLDYSGIEILHTMLLAKNYNSYLLNLICKHIELNYSIVDFGAGIGNFAQDLVEKGYNVTCIEKDNFLKEEIKNKGIKCLESLYELKNNSVDFVYSLNVLEHIEKDHEIIELINQKLKAGGGILIYVPAFTILYSKLDKKVGHFRRYSIMNLKSLMSQSNFKVIDYGYADSLGFFSTLLYKFFGNKEGNINKKALSMYDNLIFPVSLYMDKFCHKFLGKNCYVYAEKK